MFKVTINEYIIKETSIYVTTSGKIFLKLLQNELLWFTKKFVDSHLAKKVILFASIKALDEKW